jgi:hypothetical protein
MKDLNLSVPEIKKYSFGVFKFTAQKKVKFIKPFYLLGLDGQDFPCSLGG